MKALAFYLFLPIFSLWAEVCYDNSRVVLSPVTRHPSPSQQRFIESGFLSKLFSELIDIVHTNAIKIKNAKARDIILQMGGDARNPRVMNLFEVANVFGVNVSDLFKHYGNLWDFIDPSGIVADKRPLNSRKKRRISERIHLHLSGLIDETLREQDLGLKELAFQTRIKPEVFEFITVKTGLPRLPFLLQILVRLDADVTGFFKRIEASLEEVPLPARFKNASRRPFRSKKGLRAGERAAVLYETINSELKEIFQHIHEPGRDSDVMRFKNMVYYRNYQEKRRLKERPKFRKPTLDRIFQTARMLGMRPSEVLKYAGNLKSHAQLEGIEARTLLSDEKIGEFLAHIRNRLATMFEKSGMKKEELAAATQMNLGFITDINQRGLNLGYSALESVLQALGSDTIRFFEKLELEGVLDVHAANLSRSLAQGMEQFEKGSDNAFIGGRILKIRETLLPFFSNPLLDAAITKDINSKTGQTLAQRDARFKTLYKASKVANISLSDLISERPLDGLLDFRRAIIEPASQTEIDKAQKILAHLLLSEARRQKDISGLNIAELAVKSHLAIRDVKRILSGKSVPSYPALRRLAENGLGIPLPRLLENFEDKMKSFDRIPFVPKNTLLELEGLYLSEKVKARTGELRERFDQALEFLKSINIHAEELERATGIKVRHYRKNTGHIQIHTVVKFCHFLGTGLRDFMGSRNFSEMVKPKRLLFGRLSDERTRQIVGAIKDNIEQRRKSLGLSTQDLAIMLGASDKQKMESSLLNPSVISFPWYKYFQLTEILAREGEDDFFFLEEIGF